MTPLSALELRAREQVYWATREQNESLRECDHALPIEHMRLDILKSPRWVDSKYKKAVEACGFEFREFTMEWDDRMNTRLLQGRVRCLCGREERFSIQTNGKVIYYDKTGQFKDPYFCVFETGFMSPQHLRDDGFPEEIIQRAVRAQAAALA